MDASSLNYPTIRQAAARGPYSEYTLRLMLRRNELPGFFAGNRFRVNYALLMEQVDAESRSRMKTTEAAE